MAVLIAVHDETASRTLIGMLTRWGYIGRRVATGREALTALDATVDTVLVDDELPDIDTPALCAGIRRRSFAPLLVLGQPTIERQVETLDAGADDYLVKPVDPRELLARLRAVNRRRRGRRRHPDEDTVIDVRDVTIVLDTREVLVDGRPVGLTPKEFDIVASLGRHRGTTLSRVQMVREVWDSDWRGLERSLEVHVASIRRKLGTTDLIETVRGVGYRMS